MKHRRALVATSLGLVAFVIYAASMPPSFAFWDTGELQTVAAILGIAHPPACPAFVLLGWLFAHALPFGEAAWRVDIMCATAVAASVALLYATARRFGVSPLAAGLVTFGFAVASVVWKDATRAEVQDLALFFRVAALAFAFVYAERGRPRDLIAMALALGLAGATHGIAILIVPALAVVVVRRRETLAPRSLAIVAAGVTLGLVPYVYLPLRSAWLFAHHVDPTLALGIPPGAPFWDYDHPATWSNFVRVVTGADFNVRSGFAGFGDVVRYPYFAAALVTRIAAAYGFGGAILAAVGSWLAIARERSRGVGLVLAALLTVPYTEAYTELQDPDRYYLFALWCAAIAIGIAFDTLARLVQLERPSIGRYALLGALVASFVAAAPGRLALFAQRDDDGARAYVRDIEALVPDGSIVLAEWAYASPLAYASYVERSFGSRIAVAASPVQYLHDVPRWLATRDVYVVTFDSELALPGFAVVPIKARGYYVYRIAAVTP